MRYVAAYLLAALGGNENPDAKDIKTILESVGIEANDTHLNKVISGLNGKSLSDVLTLGNIKLASMPAGGAVDIASSAAAGSGGTSAPAADELETEEKTDESGDSEDGLGGLFD